MYLLDKPTIGKGSHLILFIKTFVRKNLLTPVPNFISALQ
jgi:hypothetical protein